MHKDYYGGNIPWLKTGDLNDGYIYDIPENITEKALEETSVKLNPSGSVLIAMYGATIGKVGILTFPATTNQACCACIKYDGVEQLYLFYYLLSHKEEFIMQGGGGAQPNISREKIIATYIPVPPIKEQKRIISEIENWFAIIDTLETSQNDLEATIKQTRSKILDLAIHGKLVPQDPNDELASELLKRINPKAEITSDNRQYGNIPTSWVLTTVGSIYEINPKSNVDDDTKVAFVPMANINDGFSNSFYFEERKWGEVKKGFVHFQDDDVAVAKISPCLENRKSVIFKNLPNKIGAGTTELNVFRCNKMLSLYTLAYFKSTYFIDSCAGTYNGVVGQQRVSKNYIADLPIAIPSYAEQLRIVAKIGELFSMLDEIRNGIIE